MNTLKAPYRKLVTRPKPKVVIVLLSPSDVLEPRVKLYTPDIRSSGRSFCESPKLFFSSIIESGIIYLKQTL